VNGFSSPFSVSRLNYWHHQHTSDQDMICGTPLGNPPHSQGQNDERRWYFCWNRLFCLRPAKAMPTITIHIGLHVLWSDIADYW